MRTPMLPMKSQVKCYLILANFAENQKQKECLCGKHLRHPFVTVNNFVCASFFPLFKMFLDCSYSRNLFLSRFMDLLTHRNYFTQVNTFIEFANLKPKHVSISK